jgi:hypothetical protein
MTHRSLMTLPVALLAAAVIATPAWAGEDDDDPIPTPAPTEVPTVAPTPPPVVPIPVPPAATPVPQVVPVVKERDSKSPERTVHKKKTTHKAVRKTVVRPIATVQAVRAVQVAATPAGGVQAGEGGTAGDDGGLPIAGLIGGGFLLLLAGGAAARAGVRH